MIKFELLFSVIVFAAWIYTLVDVISTPPAAVRNVPKVGWVIIVLLFPLLGTVAWYVFGRPESSVGRPAYERSTPDFPEYDRPGRAAATDPEKDEAFLKQVRDRAEEQRRRYEASRTPQPEEQQPEQPPEQ